MCTVETIGKICKTELSLEEVYCVSKTTQLWLAITSTYTVYQPILIFFRKTVIETVSNQMMICSFVHDTK